MHDLISFIQQYARGTDIIIVVLQALLLAMAVGCLAAGVWTRISATVGGPAACRLAGAADFIATIGPLIGVLGTVLGARGLVPAMTNGALANASMSMAEALGTTAVGITTAVIALGGAALLVRRGKPAAEEVLRGS